MKLLQRRKASNESQTRILSPYYLFALTIICNGLERSRSTNAECCPELQAGTVWQNHGRLARPEIQPVRVNKTLQSIYF